MFAAYRRDDFADPDGFLIQLTSILERYDDAVIEDVTSPFTGIQRRIKFPPAMAEVVEACDSEAARRKRIELLGNLKPVPRVAGPKQHRGNVFVWASAPQYEAMMVRTKGADPMDWRLDENGRPGVWVPYHWLINGAPAKKGFSTFTEDQLRALYPPREAVADTDSESVPFE